MTKTVVIKIGGSVATYKQRKGLFIRRRVLDRIADEIKSSLDSEKLRLILIHGAGTAGHQVAKQHDLIHGTNDNTEKIQAALSIQRSLQKLNQAIMYALSRKGISAICINTASTITQTDAILNTFDFNTIDKAVELGLVPVMYGDMVMDSTIGMSVCSGDTIAMNLAKRYGAEKIIFASDIDGLYDKDPHRSRDAKIINNISMEELKNSSSITVTGSHNIDVTGGLGNKIVELSGDKLPDTLKKVVICNGLRPGAVLYSLTNHENGTVIKI